MLRIALRPFGFLVGVFLFIQTAPCLQGADLPEIAKKANRLTGADSISGMVIQLSKEKNAKEELKATAALLKDKNVGLNINALWVLGRASQISRLPVEATAFYRAYITKAIDLKSPNKVLLGYAQLIDLQFGTQQYADCEKTCKEFIELTLDGEDDESGSIARAKGAILRQLILVQSRMGQPDKAFATLERLLQQQADNPLNLQLKARILRENGKDEEAIEVYEDLIAKIDARKDIKQEVRESYLADLRYALTGVYIDAKKPDKAIQLLKDLVAKYADNATYNNDLGYIMADNGKDLAEAEKLIRKALELDRALRKKMGVPPEEDKDNAAYLDSLAWVLFKRGQLAEARKILEEAVKQEEGQQAEIYDHLAEILIALKEKEKAIDLWKKALVGEAIGKREKARRLEIEKKLKAASPS
ncbi:MAG: tetratricopeptide repeat protein [Gemmataceae bacterium]|nr:tetratricopeptide repeat protein [Gemmataceae bacterium]